MAEQPVGTLIPAALRNKYPSIDYSMKITHKCLLLARPIVLLPNIQHLTRYIVTALDLSWRLDSKQILKYSNSFVTLLTDKIL